MASDLALDLTNVEKVYPGRFGKRSVHALRGIEMRVDRGAVFGLLGPNGAGKSTLVKILMTVIRPTRCDGTMLGARVGDKSALARVGYLPEHHRFPEYLSAAQVLDYFGALSNVDRATRRQRAGELLELVGLKDWQAAKVKGFSKGMRQRLGIANALMSDPDLVVLDEPTDGVDPVGRKDIREVLLRLRDQGKTIFLNSHLLSELEMVCDRVAILVQGRVSSQGTIDELTRDSRRYEIEVEARPNATPRESVEQVVHRVAPGGTIAGPPTTGAAGPQVRTTSPTAIIVSSDDAEAIQPLLDELRRAGHVLKAVRPQRASLEDLFMQAVTDRTTGRTLKPGADMSTSGRAR